MPRKFHKYKVLLDEGIPPRARFPILNHRFNLKHISLDLHKSGSSDEAVYTLAVDQKRLIVTFNSKDFIKFATRSEQSGVIGLSSNLTASQVDKKLTSLLSKSKPTDLFGKFNYISGEN